MRRLFDGTLVRVLLTHLVLFVVATSVADGEPWSQGAASTGARPLKAPIACEGFCMVTLQLEGQWVAGQQEFSASHHGRTYHFADARKRDIFLAAPQRYLPLLAGDCPVTWAETGERVAGLLRHGVAHRRRAAFFASATHREKFAAQPQAYFAAALEAEQRQAKAETSVSGDLSAAQPDSPTVAVGFSGYCPVTLKNAGRWQRGTTSFPYHWQGLEFRCVGPDEQAALAEQPEAFFSALGGYCPVTYWHTGERRRGHADFVAEYRDRLYLFATAEAKQQFLRNPEPYSDLQLGEVAADREAAAEKRPQRR